MALDASRLEELLRKIPQSRVFVLGDLMWDEYIRGDVTRISPEAPVPVLLGTSEDRTPGGAANVLKNLREQGRGMIYVSHRLDEVFAISDSVTVFRDGRLIHAGGIKDKTPQDLIIDIVGSKPKTYQSRFDARTRPVVLSGERVLAGPAGPVSFQVHA